MDQVERDNWQRVLDALEAAGDRESGGCRHCSVGDRQRCSGTCLDRHSAVSASARAALCPSLKDKAATVERTSIFPRLSRDRQIRARASRMRCPLRNTEGGLVTQDDGWRVDHRIERDIVVGSGRNLQPRCVGSGCDDGVGRGDVH